MDNQARLTALMAVLAGASILVACGDDKPGETGKADPAVLSPQAEFDRVRSVFRDNATPCFAADSAVEAAVKQSDQLEAYGAAHEGQQACHEASQAIAQTVVGAGFPEPGRGQLTAALSGCSEALESKAEAFSGQAEVFNGNMRPSDLYAARAAGEKATGQAMACAALIRHAAATAGVSTESPPSWSDAAPHE